MSELKPRTIIVHGHIFKNAGSTFDWALQRNFNKGFIDHRDNDQMRRGGAGSLANILDANQGLKAIASHHLYRWMPLPKIQGVTIIPCFFIRHPIERVRSVYTFERGQEAETPGAVYAKKLNFKDYIAWRMEHKGGGVVMNYQTKYCSGRKRAVLDNAHIAKTAEFLSSIALTGIVDRFDESMVYFEERLRCDFPQIDLSYIRQNSSTGRGKVLSVEDKVEAIVGELGAVAAKLEENNKADLTLYKRANRALDINIGQIANFDEKLSRFKNRCRALSV